MTPGHQPPVPVTNQRGSSAVARPKHGLPLLCVRAVRAVLGLNEDQPLALAECGALRFVFDLRAESARRRMLRFFARGVLEYLRRENPEGARQYAGLLSCSAHNLPVEDLVLEDVIKEILPSGHYLRTPQLQDAFGVTAGHVLHLVDDGSLEVVKGSVRHPGTRGCAAIKRASLVRFLTERRLS
jgi:hypothetical protein